ncbi:hypothetical protein ACQPZF_25110 [Actinosynnema sp. CS-041913]|uniref:hypothetical protein n=1 Tax=Actinosynnema sp. CS-041913 TaxID=3239917 RepID=UPI003D912FB0
MTPEMSRRLNLFRVEALRRDIPDADVERWLGIARPCARLTSDGDGPVVGRFGGPVLLPADAPDPWFPLVASIDCAALPGDATDLPLPDDGHLLLFAFPELSDGPESAGEVVYVPAGTPVEERDRNPYFYGEVPGYQEICEAYPQGELRLAVDVSLPYHGAVEIPEHPYMEPLPGHPHSEQLRDVWLDTCGDSGALQIGGYGWEESLEFDPVATAAWFAGEAERNGSRPVDTTGAAGDWVLLADWYTDIQDVAGATVHWAIRLDDLAARRFDRAHSTVFWNP